MFMICIGTRQNGDMRGHQQWETQLDQLETLTFSAVLLYKPSTRCDTLADLPELVITTVY